MDEYFGHFEHVLPVEPIYSASLTSIPSQKTELLRCDYCGMAYNGDEHDNCPHCLAPRTDAKPKVLFNDGAPTRSSTTYGVSCDGLTGEWHELRGRVESLKDTIDKLQTWCAEGEKGAMR